MSVTLTSAAPAISPALRVNFAGHGGTPPYTYSVLPNGAGGTINPSTGWYTAPAVVNDDPAKQSDIVRVTDSAMSPATADLPILVGDALTLFMQILKQEMGLAGDRVRLYNQKIFKPTDAGLSIAVGVISCKPFGNTNRFAGAEYDAAAEQSVNMLATLSINAISRDLSALRRKEEIIMALASQYAETQQERNSFYIGRLPVGGQFVNLSEIDGAAIPYRFQLAVNIQYFARKTQAVPYFDTFQTPTVLTDP